MQHVRAEGGPASIAQLHALHRCGNLRRRGRTSSLPAPDATTTPSADAMVAASRPAVSSTNPSPVEMRTPVRPLLISYQPWPASSATFTRLPVQAPAASQRPVARSRSRWRPGWFAAAVSSHSGRSDRELPCPCHPAGGRRRDFTGCARSNSRTSLRCATPNGSRYAKVCPCAPADNPRRRHQGQPQACSERQD